MRILVTGGAGRIGSALVQKLRTLGHEVDVFDLSRGQDVADAEVVRAAVHDKEVVYHLACTNNVGFADRFPALAMRAGAVGTANVLGACKEAGIERVVVASSTFVKQAQVGPFDPVEDREVLLDSHVDVRWSREDLARFDHCFNLAAPVTPYVMGKIAQEAVVAMFAQHYGYKVCLARYDVPIGPGMDNVAAIFVERVLAGKPLTLFGGGRSRRWYLHVDDLIEANVLLGTGQEPQKGLFEVGGPNGISVADLARLVGLALDRDVKLTQAPPEKNDYPGCPVDATGIRALGWVPRRSVPLALVDLEAWLSAGKPPADGWGWRSLTGERRAKGG